MAVNNFNTLHNCIIIMTNFCKLLKLCIKSVDCVVFGGFPFSFPFLSLYSVVIYRISLNKSLPRINAGSVYTPGGKLGCKANKRRVSNRRRGRGAYIRMCVTIYGCVRSTALQLQCRRLTLVFSLLSLHWLAMLHAVHLRSRH